MEPGWETGLEKGGTGPCRRTSAPATLPQPDLDSLTALRRVCPELPLAAALLAAQRAKSMALLGQQLLQLRGRRRVPAETLWAENELFSGSALESAKSRLHSTGWMKIQYNCRSREPGNPQPFFWPSLSGLECFMPSRLYFRGHDLGSGPG